MARRICVTRMRTSPSRRGLKALCVGLIGLPLSGSAALRVPPAIGPPATGPVADWGQPAWTLAALATPAAERVMDAQAVAQANLGPRGEAVSLLQPGAFALPAPIGPGILRAYGCLAGVRRGQTQAVSSPPSASRAAQIGRGARLSGVSPGFLLAVARAESGLSIYARARASSAAGLFQFVDQTWLRTLRRYGPGLGLAADAEAIRVGADGMARVADPVRREEILALRYDPEVAARLAGALTRENAGTLRVALGRWPTAAELYAAHLLGPDQALVLLSAAQAAPAYPAPALFPAEAAANHSLFYAGSAPRSVRALVGLIADRASEGAGR